MKDLFRLLLVLFACTVFGVLLVAVFTPVWAILIFVAGAELGSLTTVFVVIFLIGWLVGLAVIYES
jgi:hypothetical protein